MKNKPQMHGFRMTTDTKRHLLGAAVYFGCSMGSLLDILLDLVKIAPIPTNQDPKTLLAIDKFDKYINTIDEDSPTYLFKD